MSMNGENSVGVVNGLITDEKSDFLLDSSLLLDGVTKLGTTVGNGDGLNRESRCGVKPFRTALK